MKAIILAGGLGTRLHPVTLETPKALLTVKRKPIINYLIELFTRHGIKDIAVLANSAQKDDFHWWQKRHKKNLPKTLKIKWEPRLRGTFGGIRELQRELKEPFILTNGDEIKDFDLEKLLKFHKNHRYQPHATIALVKVPDPRAYGVPVMQGDEIKMFLEKPENPPTKYISSGLYVLEPEVFDYADWKKDFLMIEKDIFPKIAEKRKLIGYKVPKGKWLDCGTLDRWASAIREL
ncbi:MAG: nucleotidyltransferase family protein [Candidatus Harrisonbacteria bacterium]|nr:nucleotidyltransferase family protein [Candidatus Harrisonbacteria bacterium]